MPQEITCKSFGAEINKIVNELNSIFEETKNNII